MKKTLQIIFTFIFLSFPFENFAQEVWSPGEVLEYDVSFLGIKLGTIKIETIKEDEFNGKQVYTAKSTMQSNPGIPFVSLFAIFNSWMDKSLGFSHQFIGNTKTSDGWQYNKIDFDYEKKKITNRHWLNDSLITNDVFDVTSKINDGCSLFFFARKYSDLKKTVKVPTFIDGKFITTINFHGKREAIKIDAISYPVQTIYLDGKADWQGVYGLSGRFEGWFSDDDARIPIKAFMNVYVGKVLIELKKWKRDGWKPPKS